MKIIISNRMEQKAKKTGAKLDNLSFELPNMQDNQLPSFLLSLWAKPENEIGFFNNNQRKKADRSSEQALNEIQAALKLRPKISDAVQKLEIKRIDGRRLGATLTGQLVKTETESNIVWNTIEIDQAVYLKHRSQEAGQNVLTELVVAFERKLIKTAIAAEAVIAPAAAAPAESATPPAANRAASLTIDLSQSPTPPIATVPLEILFPDDIQNDAEWEETTFEDTEELVCDSHFVKEDKELKEEAGIQDTNAPIAEEPHSPKTPTSPSAVTSEAASRSGSEAASRSASPAPAKTATEQSRFAAFLAHPLFRAAVVGTLAGLALSFGGLGLIAALASAAVAGIASFMIQNRKHPSVPTPIEMVSLNSQDAQDANQDSPVFSKSRDLLFNYTPTPTNTGKEKLDETLYDNLKKENLETNNETNKEDPRLSCTFTQ